MFFVGQFFEGNILQPKLVGASVGLHPVWLMFALFAFGALFGFVGLLIAVPAAAAVGVLVRFALSQYLQSEMYFGRRHAAAAPLRQIETNRRAGRRSTSCRTRSRANRTRSRCHSQIPLDLPHAASLAREDLIVSPSNRLAVEAIDSWPDWRHSVLLVVGPPGSGKTHLANAWAERAGATAPRPGAAEASLAADEFPAWSSTISTGRPCRSEELFALVNAARLGGGSAAR